MRIASILWYLEYYRYMENTSQYYRFLPYLEYEMNAAFWFETDKSEDEE